MTAKNQVCTKCGGTIKYNFHENSTIKERRTCALKGCKHHWIEIN